VGGKFKRMDVSIADKGGVESHGIILAYDDLDLEPPTVEVEQLEFKETDTEPSTTTADTVTSDIDAGTKKGRNKKKKQSKPVPKKEKEKSKIVVLPSNTPIGIELPEIGRLSDANIPANQTVMECFNQRKEEVSQMLHSLEVREPSRAVLWDE